MEVWGSDLGLAKLETGYQQLATAATFLWEDMCCPGAMTQRCAPLTRYTLWRNTASIMEDLIWILSKWFVALLSTVKCYFSAILNLLVIAQSAWSLKQDILNLPTKTRETQLWVLSFVVFFVCLNQALCVCLTISTPYIYSLLLYLFSLL